MGFMLILLETWIWILAIFSFLCYSWVWSLLFGWSMNFSPWIKLVNYCIPCSLILMGILKVSEIEILSFYSWGDNCMSCSAHSYYQMHASVWVWVCLHLWLLHMDHRRKDIDFCICLLNIFSHLGGTTGKGYSRMALDLLIRLLMAVRLKTIINSLLSFPLVANNH